MEKFDGFNEISKLYADKYEIVKVLKKKCDEDLNRLFNIIEERIRNEAWFDDSWNIIKSGNYVTVFKKDWKNSAQDKVWFFLYLSVTHLKKRVFEIQINTGKNIEDIESFRNKFLKLAEKNLFRDGFRSDDFKKRGGIILKKEIKFDESSVEDLIVNEIKKLQKYSEYIDRSL